MANVAFRRGDTAYINAIAVTDGQILFDTESQAIYMDNGSSRNRYGGGNLSRSDVDTALKADSINPVQNKVIYASVLKKTDVINTLSSAIAVTDTRVPVGCGVAKELNNKISNGGDAYSPSRPYEVGDLCIHDNILYRCTTACSAGSWATNQRCFSADTLANVANMLSNDVKTKITDVFHSGSWHSYFDFYMPDNVYGLYLISSNYDDNSEMLLLQHYDDNTLITARVSGNYLNVTRSGANVGRINTTQVSGLVRGVSVIKLI